MSNFIAAHLVHGVPRSCLNFTHNTNQILVCVMDIATELCHWRQTTRWMDSSTATNFQNLYLLIDNAVSSATLSEFLRAFFVGDFLF